MDTVPARKPFNQIVPMLPYPLNQIRCHANVQCAVSSASEQIHAGLSHTRGFWMPPGPSLKAPELYPGFKKRASDSFSSSHRRKPVSSSEEPGFRHAPEWRKTPHHNTWFGSV